VLLPPGPFAPTALTDLRKGYGVVRLERGRIANDSRAGNHDSE
jgi:hypothetical protein